MRVLLISGILDERFGSVVRSLTVSLAAEGGNVVAETNPAAIAASVALGARRVDLLVATNVTPESFAAYTHALASRVVSGPVPLCVRLALGPCAAPAPSALPLALLASTDPHSIRALALEYAPRLRINAVVAVPAAISDRALEDEIAAAVLLLAQSPSMTGVTICLDTAGR